MSPGPDTMILNAIERRNLPALFAALPLLRDLDADYLQQIRTEIEWFSLPGGAVLYEAGQPADGLYVVVNGGLGVYVKRPDGGSHCVAQVPAGEPVGEMEMLSGSVRAATVLAQRDTEVARLSPATFERLVHDNPQFMRMLTGVLATRLERLWRPEALPQKVSRVLAVVPSGAGVDGAAFGAQLASSLQQSGRVEMVLKERGNEQTSQWFHRLERANDVVVYVTEAAPSNWTKLCLRQADTLVAVARHDEPARPFAALEPGAASGAGVPVDLVLLYGNAARPTPPGRWLDVHPFRRHHHVRGAQDIARVGRLLLGRATGLVLSGGGARGFAHIGVLRALLEAKLPIDAVGGSSIGSIIGAGWAAGWDYAEMVRRVRRAFVDSAPLNDYTVPLISLLAGRKVGRLLRQEFGDANIEDLRLPFFCVSANLTTGQAAVHRRGQLWLWLRASIAIPGILPPVCAQRQVYVDGATINSLPVDVMRETLSGTVIGVDVGSDRGFETDIDGTEVPALWRIPIWRRAQRKPINIMQILLRAGAMNGAAYMVGQRELTDLLLKPPLEKVDMLDWHAFDRAVEIGYRHAAEGIERYLAGQSAARAANLRPA